MWNGTGTTITATNGRSAKRGGDVEIETHDDETTTGSWSSSVRLAAMFSVLAALAAVVLAGHVPDTTIVVSIIVLGTMLSWFQLEDVPTAATVRHPRRHRSR